MNIEDRVVITKEALDLAQEELSLHEYDRALILLAQAYTEVRELLEHAWRMKRDDKLSAHPAWEDVQ